MAKIDTAYIKNNILSLYPNSDKMVRLSKRKFEYNNDQLLDDEFNPITDSNNNVIVLNGKLNWRCYAVPDDMSIFVIDDGINVLYHGELAGIPLSAFELEVELSEDDELLHIDDDDVCYLSFYMSLLFSLTIDLTSINIYEDDIRPDHIAGLNHLQTSNIESIDDPMENTVWAHFDETLDHDVLMNNVNEYYNHLKTLNFKKVSMVKNS